MTTASRLLGALARILLPSSRRGVGAAPRGRRAAGHGAPRSATVELAPEDVPGLRVEYAPSTDGDPDAGEIVWTWVPYAEKDGRGKDRPVLVIGRQSAERVYAVKLTSRPRDGQRDFVSIGSGPWDSRGRESWVDVDQLYSVHVDGMRREAAALGVNQFTRVAHVLQQRFGWTVGE